jgi:hypothetical protein
VPVATENCWTRLYREVADERAELFKEVVRKSGEIAGLHTQLAQRDDEIRRLRWELERARNANSR